MTRLPKSRSSKTLPALLLGSVLGICAATSGAHAQSIAAVVNSTPITSTQVSERAAFTRLTAKKNPPQRVIVDELIDEALVMQEARKRKITISDSDVDARYATVAQSVKLSTQQLGQALGQAGASERTFKDNIRFQLAYRRLVSGSMNVANKISEKDIAAGITAKRTEGQKIYRYTVRQIVFSMPKDASAGQVAQRQREAQAFRGKMQGCDGAIATAKGMRDVAVREPVFRTTNQVGPDLDKKLSSIKVGQATEPSRIDLGVEILALCDRQETRDDTGLRAQVQSELANEKLKEESKTYLQGLRRQAAIRYN